MQILWSASICLPLLVVGAARAAEPSDAFRFDYPPDEIRKLVAQEIARPHDSAFLPGTFAYVWKKAPGNNVFFFQRNQQFAGEYRIEKLSGNRYVEFTENYLAKSNRDPKTLEGDGERRFIRRHTLLEWEAGVSVGAVVHWTEFTADRQGNVLKVVRSATEKMKRRPVTVAIPPELYRQEAKFRGLLVTYEPLSDWEKEFDTNDLQRGVTLIEPKGAVHLQWPVSRPVEFTLTLTQIDDFSRADARQVDTMTWSPQKDASTRLTFVPDLKKLPNPKKP